MNFIDLQAQYRQYRDEINKELESVLVSARFIMGEKIEKFENELKEFIDVKHAIGCASGTDALLLSLLALDVHPGDEIIVPAYTYIASATCILQNNCIPIFVDIDPDTYNIDPERIEEAITDRTRAIMVVHFGGQPADMDRILVIAGKHNLPVIEDAAHAHGCEWKKEKAGSFGLFSSFSFQASKNMTSGEGGILCSNDRSFASECDSLMWCGRKVGRPWYEYHRLGWNYRMTEFQAAILRQQLTRLDEQVRYRECKAQYLSKRLERIDGISPLIQDERTTLHGYHIYMFRYDESAIGLNGDCQDSCRLF